MSKLDALTNFEVFIKFMRKEGFLMKKMLAKAVVLGLVLGGIGFVANDAQAAAAKNADDIKTNADNINANKNAIEANSKAIKANGEAINTERDQRVAMDNALKKSVDTERDQRVAMDNALKKSIDTERDQRVAMDNALKKSIDTERDQRVAMDNALKKSIDTERDQRVAMDNVLDKKITDEATNRANEDKRIEAKFDGEVSRLDGRIDKLNDNVQKVGAMAAAIANLHTMGYDPEAPTEIAVGVGQYRDKTGMALGAFHYPNRDFMLSFSVSTAGDEYMGGIGATWKFGRKTPEELRQAEAEKAAKAKLAKAEAAKKAAKDARVAAQQKRHAEMLAARTAK